MLPEVALCLSLCWCCIVWSMLSSKSSLCSPGEQGMIDEAQKALEEAEALKKVCVFL